MVWDKKLENSEKVLFWASMGRLGLNVRLNWLRWILRRKRGVVGGVMQVLYFPTSQKLDLAPGRSELKHPASILRL